MSTVNVTRGPLTSAGGMPYVVAAVSIIHEGIEYGKAGVALFARRGQSRNGPVRTTQGPSQPMTAREAVAIKRGPGRPRLSDTEKAARKALRDAEKTTVSSSKVDGLAIPWSTLSPAEQQRLLAAARPK